MATKVLDRQRQREKTKIRTIACPSNISVTLALTMGEVVK